MENESEGAEFHRLVNERFGEWSVGKIISRKRKRRLGIKVIASSLTVFSNNAIFYTDMKVYLETLGCKLNESELEAWSRQFAAEGNQIVAKPADADVCVLNTCTVTAQAARKSRNLARQMARANPNVRIVLTGCYASTAPKEARKLPNVALVVPNAEKERLVQLANDILPLADCAIEATNHQPTSIGQSRTRAFVKIQDGCNMSCTYCIIPLARGKERSRPLDEVVAEVQSLVDSGYKEIILTGVQISEYRISPIMIEKWGGGGIGLCDLVIAILAETNVPRLRLTSIAPWDLDETMLDLFSNARLCRHLHLSLQSGSDNVLRRMRRPYATAQFARAVEMARAKIPDVAITTDVIVGFPGESDVEFEQSLEFVERMQFARAHVFSYSARAGTIAAGLPLHVSDATKAARAQKMQGIADNAARAFASRFIGREMSVLWESRESGNRGAEEQGKWLGHTDNYVRVIAESEDNLHNRIQRAMLIAPVDDGAYANLV